MCCGGNVEPNIWTKAKTYANALIDSKLRKITYYCSKEHNLERLYMCSMCDNIKRANKLPKGAMVMKGDTCSLCGCFLTKKSSEFNSKYYSCPLKSDEFPNGKWFEIDKKYAKRDGLELNYLEDAKENEQVSQ